MRDLLILLPPEDFFDFLDDEALALPNWCPLVMFAIMTRKFKAQVLVACNVRPRLHQVTCNSASKNFVHAIHHKETQTKKLRQRTHQPSSVCL